MFFLSVLLFSLCLCCPHSHSIMFPLIITYIKHDRQRKPVSSFFFFCFFLLYDFKCKEICSRGSPIRLPVTADYFTWLFLNQSLEERWNHYDWLGSVRAHSSQQVVAPLHGTHDCWRHMNKSLLLLRRIIELVVSAGSEMTYFQSCYHL
jgi:hypothetical protein